MNSENKKKHNLSTSICSKQLNNVSMKSSRAQYALISNVDHNLKNQNKRKSIPSRSNELIASEFIKQLQTQYESISHYNIAHSNNLHLSHGSQKNSPLHHFNIIQQKNYQAKGQTLKKKQTSPNFQKERQTKSSLHIQQISTFDDDDQLDSPYRGSVNHYHNHFQNFKKQTSNHIDQQIFNYYSKYPNRKPKKYLTQSKNRKSKQLSESENENELKLDLELNSPNDQNNANNQINHHPIFRDTLEYIDANKFDLRDQSMQLYDKKSVSSESATHTHIDQRQSYRYKYKKYKQKYLETLDFLRQLQILNQTLINDQRQNYAYYQNQIKKLQKLLAIKDQQIELLNQYLTQYEKNSNEKHNLYSLEGRKIEILQNENAELINEIQIRSKEIQTLRTNLQKSSLKFNVDQSFQLTESKAKDKNIENLQKKLFYQMQEIQNLDKKCKNLEQLNIVYEQKIRQKQKRISKMSNLNSQLQEQLLRIKSSKKEQKNEFMEQNNEKQIQNTNTVKMYLDCINEQIQLIKERVNKKKDKEIKLVSISKNIENGKNNQTHFTINQLKNMVSKLQNFNQSIDIL